MTPLITETANAPVAISPVFLNFEADGFRVLASVRECCWDVSVHRPSGSKLVIRSINEAWAFDLAARFLPHSAAANFEMAWRVYVKQAIDSCAAAALDGSDLLNRYWSAKRRGDTVTANYLADLLLEIPAPHE